MNIGVELTRSTSVARSIGAVIAGILSAFAVVLGVETIGLQMFPQPAGMDALNPESIRQHMSEIHVGSFIVVIIAWAIAAFVGPVVARRVAGSRSTWPSIVVVGLFALMCAYNLIAVPGPRWMIPAALIFVGTSSVLGLRRRVPGTTTA